MIDFRLVAALIALVVTFLITAAFVIAGLGGMRYRSRRARSERERRRD